MTPLIITVIIAFFVVLIAIVLLAVGLLITGKSKIRRGACGSLPPTNPKETCPDNKENNISCGLCKKEKK